MAAKDPYHADYLYATPAPTRPKVKTSNAAIGSTQITIQRRCGIDGEKETIKRFDKEGSKQSKSQHHELKAVQQQLK